MPNEAGNVVSRCSWENTRERRCPTSTTHLHVTPTLHVGPMRRDPLGALQTRGDACRARSRTILEKSTPQHASAMGGPAAPSRRSFCLYGTLHAPGRPSSSVAPFGVSIASAIGAYKSSVSHVRRQTYEVPRNRRRDHSTCANASRHRWGRVPQRCPFDIDCA